MTNPADNGLELSILAMREIRCGREMSDLRAVFPITLFSSGELSVPRAIPRQYNFQETTPI